jgi:TolA-binding protein
MSPLKAEDTPDASLNSCAGATSPHESLSNAKITGRKRRASTTGSRGIANLTPEQLAKKRANDREAQRAIRERTKHQIESLERKIRELQCQQPYQELQHVIRQKEAVEAENAEIKSRLTAILNIVQPILAGREAGMDMEQALLAAVANGLMV